MDLSMINNNAEVIIKTRSLFDRRRVKDRRSFFKQKYLDHNPERRANMVGRRMIGDRRRLLPESIYTFGKKDFNF
jgi:hypothetical protein